MTALLIVIAGFGFAMILILALGLARMAADPNDECHWPEEDANENILGDDDE